MTNHTDAAKFDRLAAFHFAKAAENGPRASYYRRLAEGEARRAATLRGEA